MQETEPREYVAIIHNARGESHTLAKIPLDRHGEALAAIVAALAKIPAIQALTEGSCPNRNE